MLISLIILGLKKCSLSGSIQSIYIPKNEYLYIIIIVVGVVIVIVVVIIIIVYTLSCRAEFGLHVLGAVQAHSPKARTESTLGITSCCNKQKKMGQEDEGPNNQNMYFKRPNKYAKHQNSLSSCY